MITNNTTKEIEKRTQRYWYEDGIWELAFGLINALLGCYLLITAQFNWNGPYAIALLLLQMAFIIGMFWSINKIVKFLKERITYPRTGYVAYRRPATGTRLKRALVSMGIAISIGLLIAALSALRVAPNRLPLVTSIFLAGSLVYIGSRFNLFRHYIQAALTVGWGFFIAFLPLAEETITGTFFVGFGLLILLSGGVILANYLRHTSPAGSLETYEPPEDVSSTKDASAAGNALASDEHESGSNRDLL